MLVSILIFWHFVSLCLSSSSDEHHSTHSCFGTSMSCLWSMKHPCHSCSTLSIIFIPKCLWFLLVCWWDQYHDTAISGTDCSELRSGDEYWLVCVTWWTGHNHHDTVIVCARFLDVKVHKEPFSSAKRDLQAAFNKRSEVREAHLQVWNVDIHKAMKACEKRHVTVEGSRDF